MLLLALHLSYCYSLHVHMYLLHVFFMRVVRRRTMLARWQLSLNMAMVKVFQKEIKLQGQGHNVKNYGTV